MSAPEPRAIARSMFSFGIEYERAFSIAFWSARFAAGSPPPSRAATMRARASFEKSLPRFASAAPFLCLIELHLLCPDMPLLPHELEEALVHASVVGQLRMEGGHDRPALTQQHRLAVELREHLDTGTRVEHARRADEDPVQRLVLAGELEIGLEARDLPAVGVPAHLEVEQPEVAPVEQDHPGAGAENGPLEAPDRVLEPVETHEPGDCGRLTAGDDQPVEIRELSGLAHLDRLGAEPAEDGGVLAHIPLHREDSDLWSSAHDPDSRQAARTIRPAARRV